MTFPGAWQHHGSTARGDAAKLHLCDGDAAGWCGTFLTGLKPAAGVGRRMGDQGVCRAVVVAGLPSRAVSAVAGHVLRFARLAERSGTFLGLPYPTHAGQCPHRDSAAPGCVGAYLKPLSACSTSASRRGLPRWSRRRQPRCHPQAASSRPPRPRWRSPGRGTAGHDAPVGLQPPALRREPIGRTRHPGPRRGGGGPPAVRGAARRRPFKSRTAGRVDLRRCKVVADVGSRGCSELPVSPAVSMGPP
jgi:hypothetical protein